MNKWYIHRKCAKMRYIYHRKDWPHFTWDHELVDPLLNDIKGRQKLLSVKMNGLGFNLKDEAMLETFTVDVLKTSEIEGEHLNADEVRSSIARKLGMDIAGLIPADRHVEGIVEMMLDATKQYALPLTAERLFGWHAALFPTGRNGMQKIVVANWRDNKPDDPMQVVSGPLHRQTVHFQAPDADTIADEMNAFLKWFNDETIHYDDILKSVIAHLWFVTIHPFDDGNGRIARAIADMLLVRSDEDHQRFYSMSAQIRKERNAYYAMLQETQSGDMDITKWLQWFLECLGRAIQGAEEMLKTVLFKAAFWLKHQQVILNERQKLMINKMLDGFTGKLTSSKWAAITKTSSDTALRNINDLIDKNILEKEEAGGRSVSYKLKDI